MAKNVVVIGGGVAGMAAAGKLRGFGYDVVLIEKAEELGGNLKSYKRFAVGVLGKCPITNPMQRLSADAQLSR